MLSVVVAGTVADHHQASVVADSAALVAADNQTAAWYIRHRVDESYALEHQSNNSDRKQVGHLHCSFLTPLLL